MLSCSPAVTMPLRTIDNVGSTARDWCMFERNLLSHIKLSLLLSLLSWAVLLHARISDSTQQYNVQSSIDPKSSLPLGLVFFISALVSLFSGIWEYVVGIRDLESKRAFLVASRCV